MDLNKSKKIKQSSESSYVLLSQGDSESILEKHGPVDLQVCVTD